MISSDKITYSARFRVQVAADIKRLVGLRSIDQVGVRESEANAITRLDGCSAHEAEVQVFSN